MRRWNDPVRTDTSHTYSTTFWNDSLIKVRFTTLTAVLLQKKAFCDVVSYRRKHKILKNRYFCNHYAACVRACVLFELVNQL